MMKIEYRVRKVERFIVTRYEESAVNPATVKEVGEYPNGEVAYNVAYALAKHEQDQLGCPPGDDRIVYPEPFDFAPLQA